MVKLGRKSRNSRQEKNKNVLKTRTPNNSRSSRHSNNSRNLGNSRLSNNSRNSRSSIWSKGSGPRKPRSSRQIILMAIILIAFICGLALGVSMIMGIGADNSDSGGVHYMNVTDNITVYENSSYDLQDENGTQISYYDFDENVTEGQNITAFNATNGAGIY
ncbi:MAG: hypothetical protein Q4P11_07300 [Methanobrevibacter sp.]|nr:hypothetical protein [Methanobrevibacter sp.]